MSPMPTPMMMSKSKPPTFTPPDKTVNYLKIGQEKYVKGFAAMGLPGAENNAAGFNAMMERVDAKRDRTPHKKMRRRRGTLVLADMENVSFGLQSDRIEAFHTLLTEHVVKKHPGNRFLAASAPRYAEALSSLPESVEKLVREGADGAETALIEEIKWDHAVRVYENLVIVSGDHMFLPVAMYAREMGVRVTLVTGKNISAVHRPLADSCHQWVRLKSMDEIFGANEDRAQKEMS